MVVLSSPRTPLFNQDPRNPGHGLGLATTCSEHAPLGNDAQNRFYAPFQTDLVTHYAPRQEQGYCKDSSVIK